MKTPLFDVHQKLGARMGPFAGWDMPIQYEGIIQEHVYTRTKASIFDTCHMGVFDLRGKGALADVERLVTQNVRDLEIGQCRYGFMLNPEGGVIDDLTVYRRASDHFFLVVNAGTLNGDADWIRSHLTDQTVFTDLSQATAKLDVQGPTSRREMESVFGHSLPELKYFRFTDTTLGGMPCTLSRTGYTGEWGYEIYFPRAEAARVWKLLTERSAIRPAGLGARDTLRLEVGYPLYGHELDTSRTPVGFSRGMFIDLQKECIGIKPVRHEMEHGAPFYLVGLQLETRRAARAGDVVFYQGENVGVVTSGSFAPTVDRAVALAYVKSGLDAVGAAVEIEVRDRPLSATVVELPFFRGGTARAKSVPCV